MKNIQKYLNQFHVHYNSNKDDFEIDDLEINNIINGISFWKKNIIDIVVKKKLDNAFIYDLLLKKIYENLQ